MKSLLFIKSTEPTLQVEVMIDVESTLAKIAEVGFEAICTIMETKNLTDSAISQGLDLTKKVERSFQGLIEMGKSVPVDSIKIIDYTSSSSEVLYSRLLIVATDDVVADADGGAGEADVINVLTNDTLDGDPVTLSTVTLEEISNDSDSALTLNADGSVDVGAGTDAGDYTIVYKISEIANPANSDTGTLVVTVTV